MANVTLERESTGTSCFVKEIKKKSQVFCKRGLSARVSKNKSFGGCFVFFLQSFKEELCLTKRRQDGSIFVYLPSERPPRFDRLAIAKTALAAPCWGEARKKQVIARDVFATSRVCLSTTGSELGREFCFLFWTPSHTLDSDRQRVGDRIEREPLSRQAGS